MKVLFAIFLVISFIGIAVFGALAMNHASGHGAFGCIAATASAVDCPNEANLFSLVDFHFNAFKNFSSAVFGENILNLILFTLVFALIAGAAIFAHAIITPPQIPVLSYPTRTSDAFSQKRKLIYWLSLHENSPNFV